MIRTLARLAVPLALTQLAQVALTTTDTVLLAGLGTGGLAAGGLAMVVFNQLRTMGVGLVTAVGNQVAAAPDDSTRIRQVVRAALALATAAGLGGGVLMILLGRVIGHGTETMLVVLAPGLLPCLWFQAIRQFTVGMRRPQALLRITLGSVAVNAVLDWAFLRLGWGVAGVGLATSLVYLLSAAALFLAVRRDRELAGLLSLRGDLGVLPRLVGLGLPIAATYGSEAGFFTVTALLAASYGTAALAAHTAVNQLVYIVFQVTVGLSHAASIQVSRERALGDRDAIRRVRTTALACGAVVMAMAGACYVLLPELVLRPFFDRGSPGYREACGLLVIAAMLQFADCAQNIGVGLLRGLDDTRSGFRLSLVGYWAVGLPAAWGLSRSLGLRGVWLGVLLGLAATACLLLRRFEMASENKICLDKVKLR